MTQRDSGWFRFQGANIKGTPKMLDDHAAEDMELILNQAAVVVVQEFRHRGYWVAVRRRARWLEAKVKSYPNWKFGIVRPVRGAQAIFWRKNMWKKKRGWLVKAHDGVAGISEDRYWRGALLKRRKVNLRFSAWSGHMVVKGDRKDSSRARRNLMALDLRTLDKFLGKLPEEWPSLGEFDGNMHKHSQSHAELMKVLRKHGFQVLGSHGSEYLVGRNGTKATLEVRKLLSIPADRMWTDHETRGAEVRLVER